MDKPTPKERIEHILDSIRLIREFVGCLYQLSPCLTEGACDRSIPGKFSLWMLS
ncbi:MAG TPA: hypothetical protein PLG90_03595 [Ignavibacteria bacterium]|nr:hypothetical protein [Ignavibacteria bacterium]